MPREGYLDPASPLRWPQRRGLSAAVAVLCLLAQHLVVADEAIISADGVSNIQASGVDEQDRSIEVLLQHHGLGEYARNFLEERITLADVADVSEMDMQELNIPIGPRKRMLRIFAQMQPGKGRKLTARRDSPDGSRRARITALLMVKNEEAGIEATIRSLMGNPEEGMDVVLIADTGSTDGTLRIAHRLSKEAREDPECLTHIVIKSLPFVNFAHTRNSVIDIATANCSDNTSSSLYCPDYLLAVDADDELRGAKQLRRFCDAQLTAAQSAFFIIRKLAVSPPDPTGKRFSEDNHAVVLWRPLRGWQYEGVVHEVLLHPSLPVPTVTVPGVALWQDRFMVMNRPGYNRTRKFMRDAMMLTEERKRNPADTRVAFYLAYSLANARRYDLALNAYRDRIVMNSSGWNEERYISAFYSARILLGGREGGPNMTTTHRAKLALQYFQLASTIEPSRIDHYGLMASLLVHTGRGATAMTVLDKCRAILDQHRQQRDSSDVFLFHEAVNYNADSPCLSSSLRTAAKLLQAVEIVCGNSRSDNDRQGAASQLGISLPHFQVSPSGEAVPENHSGPVFVHGAGSIFVNGVYHPDGTHAGAQQYVKDLGSAGKIELFRVQGDRTVNAGADGESAGWWNFQQVFASGAYAPHPLYGCFYDVGEWWGRQRPPALNWGSKALNKNWLGAEPSPIVLTHLANNPHIQYSADGVLHDGVLHGVDDDIDISLWDIPKAGEAT